MRVPRALAALAGLCAVLAGVLLAALAVLTCLVVAGRQSDTWVLVGDFELTAVASGAAVAELAATGPRLDYTHVEGRGWVVTGNGILQARSKTVSSAPLNHNRCRNLELLLHGAHPRE